MPESLRPVEDQTPDCAEQSIDLTCSPDIGSTLTKVTVKLSNGAKTIEMPQIAFLIAFTSVILIGETDLLSKLCLAVFFVGFNLSIPYAVAHGAKTQEITLDSTGITFPSIRSASLFGQLHRPWSDIHSIIICGLENWDLSKWKRKHLVFDPAVPHRISIDFKSGGTAEIELSELPKAQLVKFINALNTWGNPAVLSSNMIKVQNALMCESLERTDFTNLWVSQLESNYSTTQFRTLPPFTLLQNGRFRIITQLAGSGLSAVYLASNDEHDKVIVKESTSPATSDEQVKRKSVELLKREAEVLSRLMHPQLARVIDFFVEGDRNYLVMEYVRGQSLRQVVEQIGKQSEQIVIGWGQQLASILSYLHAQEPPVVHRDVTPDNIVLREDGKLVLIDFGACSHYIGAVTGTVIGKQCYMPPEQFRGRSQPSSDIYSLGMTLSYLLTGCDPEPLSQAHPRQVIPTLSEQLNALIAKCTATRVSERFPDSRALEEALKGLKK